MRGTPSDTAKLSKVGARKRFFLKKEAKTFAPGAAHGW
jgi:hypothetical protein